MKSRKCGQYFKIQAKKLQLTPFLLDYHPQSQHLHMFLHSCFLKLKTKAHHYHKPRSVAMRWGLLDKLHPGHYILLLQRLQGHSNEFHTRHVYCTPLVLMGVQNNQARRRHYICWTLNEAICIISQGPAQIKSSSRSSFSMCCTYCWLKRMHLRHLTLGC